MNSPLQPVPPTPLQQACVARSLLAPAGGHYLQLLVCDWREPLDLRLWEEAWNLVAVRHEVLRAWFSWGNEQGIAQHFAEAVTTRVEVRPIPGDADRSRLLSEFLQSDRRRGFNLGSPPLWRLSVFPWSEQTATTIWTFHHSLLDGRSHALVWQEVNALYRSLLNGAALPMPPAKSFRDFVAWLGKTSEQAAAGYWREALRDFRGATDLPTLSLSEDSGDDDLPPATEVLVLGEEITDELRSCAQRHGVTLNNLIQASWALALGRYQAVEEVVFGAVRSGRHWTEDDPGSRVGLFINTVPFRVNTSASQGLGDWLRTLRAQQLAVRAGEHASTEQIRRWCGLPKSAVLFRTCLMFDNRDSAEALSNAIQSVRLIEKTDLPTLAAYEGSRLTLAFDYSPARHPRAQAQTILRHVAALLKSIASAREDARLGELKQLTPEEHHLMLEVWQGPVTPQPAPPLHRVLQAQAEKTPDAPAVEFLGETLSYQQLHEQANRLGRRLREYCRADDRVAVVLERALDQPVVWLAALKAGLLYAPVDPVNPRERLDFIFHDLQPSVLVTQQALLPLLPCGHFRVLCLDAAEEKAALAALEASDLDLNPPKESPVNLFYTSGSTGEPKAVLNSRAGLDNFALYLRREFDLGPGDRVLQSSSTAFDASIFDLVAALQAGATLVLVPSGQLRPGPSLTRLLAEQRISVTFLTPTVMRSSPVPAPPTVRLLVSGGEPLTAELVQRWSPGRRVFNVCGPTECSLWFNGEEVFPDGNRPTIGGFILHCRGYVLDDDRQPVPVGVPGELYLAGVGVGLGYWNRPELTAERFLPDPFVQGARMYRTGDGVRWLADGRIEHLGRLDSQVKVQGVRVELGEIESALRRHPAVADAAVVLHEEKLMAWFVPRGSAPSEAALRAWLADHIAQIFLPAAFHTVAELPRTVSGKTDRPTLLNRWLQSRAEQELPVAERQRVIEEWNQTAKPYPLERTVLDFFREQVKQRPKAIALKSGAQSVRYAELNDRADRLAQRLLGEGLQPEEIVALRFERCVAFVVSALAVLKAGGAYLPLDASIPPARQAFVLDDSSARFVLTAKTFADSFSSWKGHCLVVENEAAEGTNETKTESESEPRLRASPQQRAYGIYTSGSTGQPKCVEIEHRSLTNLICFYRERLQLTPADRSTLLANPAFDASVADLWPMLCAGGTVLIPNRALLDEPDRLITWLTEEGATFSFLPTALGELLFHRPWPKAMALRFLCVGGEALRSQPPPGLPFAVINSYGPTENTVDSTWEFLAPVGDGARPGIGRPIANVRAYVLNGHLQPVAAGVAGELFLGGAQVARGYLNRAELTRERFLPDPFSGVQAGRMYRTGDWVRWRADGTLEFLGRRDDQIQIRGQRVELGEIEAAIRKHPGVGDVCCRPALDRGAATPGSAAGVVAHVVLADAAEKEIGTRLRSFLEPVLAAYMIPTAFVVHDKIPLTPQGKVDRAALDAAVRQQPWPAGEVEIVSADSLVRKLTELWHEVIPNGNGARAEETFQQLGGDSLGAVKLLLGVEGITGRRLALSTFLLEPTLAGLCRAVAAAEDDGEVSILALRRGGARPPVFCAYEMGGDVGGYFDLAAELGADQPVFGIRSAAIHHVERIPDSIEAAARQARGRLRAFLPSGPFALVGFSWGGLLAFEMARQFSMEEGWNPFCALFGTTAPPRRPSVPRKVLHAVRWLPRWAWRLAQDKGRRWQRIREAVVSRRFVRNLVAEEKLPLPPWANDPVTLRYIGLAHHYQPPVRRPVPIHLFRESRSIRRESHPAGFALMDHYEDGGWRHWAGCQPQVHWLDGEHTMVLKRPLVKKTAEHLRAALERHFAQDARARRCNQG